MAQNRTISLSQEGPRFSRIVPGLMRLNEWGLDAPALLDWIEACLDMGLTTFDHADIYGGYTCEAAFGAALALKPSLREQMQLVSKCDIMLISENRPQTQVKHYDTRRDHIIASVERSLANLRTDYLDLLLIHRPDPLMDADEVAEALVALRSAGKVAYVGVSNFMPWTFDLLQSRLDFPLVTNQVEFSVNHLEPLHDGTFDQCQQRRIAPMVWSPLGGGRIFWADDEAAQRLRATLGQIGEELGGVPLDQVALAFVLMHPAHPLPVMGTGKLDRLRGAVSALDVALTRQQWFRIWQAATGHEVP